MQRPFLFIAGFFGLGITCARYFDIPLTLPVSLLAFLLLGIIISSRMAKNEKTALYCLGAIYCAGFISFYLNSHPPSREYDLGRFIGKGVITLEGIIDSPPEESRDRTTLTITTTKIFTQIATADAAPIQGRIIISLLNTAKTPGRFRYGDYVRLQTRLRSLDSFNNPGSIDWASSKRYRGFMARGHIGSPAGIVLLRSGQGNYLRTKLDSVRDRILDFIRTKTPGQAGAIIAAMTVGARGMIDETTWDVFRKSGTAHILSISGLHVGIVAFIFIFLLDRILRSWEGLALRVSVRATSHLTAVIPLIFYALIAGGSIPVVRATIMVLTLVLALLLGRHRDLPNFLALAGFLILLVSPGELFDISFQLSFAAVAAILLFTPVAQEKVNKIETTSPMVWIGKTSLLMFAVSFSAFLGTLPLIAHYFYLFSPIALLANMLAVPLLGFIALPLSLAAIVTFFLYQPLAEMLLFTATAIVDITMFVTHLLVSIPGSSVMVLPPPFYQIAVYFLLLILLSSILSESKHWKPSMKTSFRLKGITIAALLLILFASLFYQYNRGLFLTETRITAIDVGHGSSTLIELPRGKTILVDGGGIPSGRFDMGRNVVAPVLLYRGIRSLDLVIVSHPHTDHIQGLIYVLNNFKIREVWTNGRSSTDKDFLKLMAMVEQKKIPHRRLSDVCPPITVNGAVFRIMNPTAATSANNDKADSFADTNNSSLVFVLSVGRHNFFFTGDIMARAERDILERRHNIASNVLFAPHHGSRTSSTPEFIAAVNPRLAIISAGGDLPFPLPHKETLRLYEKMGITVKQTDLHGAITIVTDGVFIEAGSQLAN